MQRIYEEMSENDDNKQVTAELSKHILTGEAISICKTGSIIRGTDTCAGKMIILFVTMIAVAHSVDDKLDDTRATLLLGITRAQCHLDPLAAI